MSEQFVRYVFSLAAGLFAVLCVFAFFSNWLHKQSVKAQFCVAAQESLNSLPYLLDRNAFRAALNHELRKAEACHGHVGLVLVEIEDLRIANCVLGAIEGDDLHVRVAALLSESVEGGGIVSHIGGNEFAVGIGVHAACNIVPRVAGRIADALGGTLRGGRRSGGITASIGYCAYPEGAVDATTLMGNGLIALYEAKACGKGKIVGFLPTMAESVRRRVFLENELRNAFEEGGLALMYQPQFDMRSGELVGAEALLRWTHACAGTISPAEFIPLAESSDLIVLLGRWVLQQACLTAASWNKVDNRKPLHVAVNVSACQLEHPGFFSDVMDALALSGLVPSLLELELTESCAVSSLPLSVDLMVRLRAAGVRFAVDDFGTGYSSLTYLHTLPVDALKMDKSFIKSFSHQNVCIARAIISMAHGLKLTVIAEGIERWDQIEWLIAEGCDLVQGYLTGAPVTGLQIMEIAGKSPHRCLRRPGIEPHPLAK